MPGNTPGRCGRWTADVDAARRVRFPRPAPSARDDGPAGGAVATVSVVPAHVAASSGIFERHGLRVTITESNDLNGFAAALDQGQYDIVLSVPSIVLVAADHGLDVQIVNRMNKASADHPGTVWITRDPAVESIGQLRGARIGVPALTGQLTDPWCTCCSGRAWRRTRSRSSRRRSPPCWTN